MEAASPSPEKTEHAAGVMARGKLLLASLSAAVFGTLGYAAGHWLGSKGAPSNAPATARRWAGATTGLFCGTVAFYGAMNSSHTQTSRGEAPPAAPSGEMPEARIQAASGSRDGVIAEAAEHHLPAR